MRLLSSKNVLLKTILLLVLIVIVSHRSAIAEEANEIISFKQFLSSQPCISRMIYTQQAGCNPNSQLDRIFALAYCGDGFYIRHVKAEDIDKPISPQNKMRGSLFAGKSGDVRWQISGFSIKKSFNPNLDRPDTYAAFSDIMLFSVDGIINFGSQEILPGSFVWHGDDFEAMPNAFGWQMHPNAQKYIGKLLIISNKVVQMEINLVTKDNTSFLDRYTYEYNSDFTNRPAWFPSKLVQKSGSRCRIVTFDKVVFGNPTDIDMVDQFLPETHVASEVRLLTIISNSQIVASPNMRDAGVVNIVRQGIDNHKLVESRGRLSVYVKIFLIIILVIPIVGFIGWKIYKYRQDK